MTATRKPRADAILSALPELARDELYDRAQRERAKDLIPWLKAEHGLAIKPTALYEWLAGERQRRFIAGANNNARAFAEWARSFDSSLTPDEVERIADLKFAMDTAAGGDAKAYAAVTAIIQRRRELAAGQKAHADKMSIAERKLALDQEKLKLRVRELEGDLQRARKTAAKVSQDLGKEKLSTAAVARIRDAVMEIAMGRKPAKS